MFYNNGIEFSFYVIAMFEATIIYMFNLNIETLISSKVYLLIEH